MDVEFVKINESFSKIHTEDSILYELKDYLTFTVPNARFTPAFKKGWWDGTICLLNRDKSIYSGLCDTVKRFCKERGYSFDALGFVPPYELDPNALLKDINDWKPTRYEKGERVPLVPHKEQLHAIWVAMCTRRCIIESATAAGKSFIIWSLLRLLIPGRKALVIVPRVDLATQLHNDKDEYFHGWNQDVDVLYSGQELTEAPIVISTWQSIVKKSDDYFKQFDVLIEDEVHEGDAKSTCSVVEKCVNANYRIGLTGSLKDSKTAKLTLMGLFGSSYKISSAADNIKKGISAPVKIKIIKKKWKKRLSPKGDKWDGTERFNAESEYIETNAVRNELIYNIAKECKGTHLVLFKSVEHGNLMYEQYKKLNPNTFLIHSKVPKKKRDEIIKFAKANPKLNICIIASIGTFSTGINIPNIKTIILACPLKGSNVKLKQGIGRGLRIKDDGSHLIFIDIMDCIGRGSTLEKQAHSRIELYISEKFPYKVIEI